MLWAIAGTLVAAYAAILILMFVFQSHLVYFPVRAVAETPASRGLPFEEAQLTASDGTRLAAWFIPAPNPTGVVLFCHGNAGNISHRLDVAAFFRGLGLSTLLFDYRGYGRSEGRPTEAGTYLDADAAWRHLAGERRLPRRQIIVWGESLGGPIAAWLAREHPPGVLVLQSTFTSVPDLAARLYPWLPVRLLSRFRYSTLEYVRQAACPILVMHSPADEIVPYPHGRQLFESAGDPKAFIELAGGHNDGFFLSGRPFAESLQAFLTTHVAP
mgnify:CR=1 FL=1